MSQQGSAKKPIRRIRIVPPVYLAAAVAVMIALAWWLPGARIVPAPWNWLGLVPVFGGIGLGIVAARLFARHKTTFVPGRTSSQLLTAGPYRWTRNPVYVAMTMSLVGVALLLGVLTPWLLVPIFVAVIAVNVIPVEEVMLVEAFGEEYRAYRRWCAAGYENCRTGTASDVMDQSRERSGIRGPCTPHRRAASTGVRLALLSISPTW